MCKETREQKTGKSQDRTVEMFQTEKDGQKRTTTLLKRPMEISKSAEHSS
jgi:hypothetical protein